MRWADIPTKPTSRMLRQFAAAWLVFFLALALHRTFVRHQPTIGYALSAISLIGIVGLLKPQTLRWLFVGASIAAFPIGWVITHLVLAGMFYLLLTPLALWFRWRNRDELRLRPKPGSTSYWVERGDPPPPENYLKQF